MRNLMNLKNYYLVCLLMLFGSCFESKAQSWVDISSEWIKLQGLTQGPTVYHPGCGGVIVNRLTGDVIINITGDENVNDHDWGLWKTSDRGETYVRIDNETVGGRCAAAWAIQNDQDNPERIAMFSIDGKSAYTTDGVNWESWTTQRRNWDHGAVNWDSPSAKVIFAARHEHEGGMLQLSNDGGITWKELSIKVNMQEVKSGVMIGVIDSLTLLHSNYNGIQRSTDQGETWTKVADAVVRNKVAVMFKGDCYVGTDKGLLVSKDKGATWAIQGTKIDVVQGPYFGADENTMVIVNETGMHKSTDAGETWKLLTTLYPEGWHQYSIKDVTWFGRYVWDPINNVCYATAIGHQVFKKELGEIDIIPPTAPREVEVTNLTSTGFTVKWAAATDNVRVTGYEVFAGEESCGVTAARSMKVTGLTANSTYAVTVKASDAEGNVSEPSDVIYVTTLPIPENLQASEISDTSFKLSWSLLSDKVEITGYNVFKDGKEYKSTTDTYMTISGLTPETLYTMRVKAVDAVGNQSNLSIALPVSTFTIGTDNSAASEIIIYPNPAGESITIEVPENTSGSVAIYNASGVAVAEKTIQTGAIKMDVSAFPKGTYLAKIMFGDKHVTKSFIVE